MREIAGMACTKDVIITDYNVFLRGGRTGGGIVQLNLIAVMFNVRICLKCMHAYKKILGQKIMLYTVGLVCFSEFALIVGHTVPARHLRRCCLRLSLHANSATMASKTHIILFYFK